MPIEKSRLRLGVLPLSDAAPLVVAQARGFFARHGLQVDLALEPSWATLRDKVATGLLDGAQMLAPMPIAATLGLNGVRVPMITALSLSLNGNAITVSRTLHARMRGEAPSQPDAAQWAAALARVLASDRRVGRAPPTFAHVFPYSTHHYELLMWLASAGIQPERDVRLTVVPPARMLAELSAGRIDGFCVGAPWGEAAARNGVGELIVGKHQIWSNSPEKVLGVTLDWAQRHPATHLRLIAALIETSRWLDVDEHRDQAARLLVEGGWVQAPAETVHESLQLRGGGLWFRQHAATFPWRSQAMWFALQMQHWGHVAPIADLRALAERVYRSDLYREAAARVSEPCPPLDYKSEGGHAGAWTLQARDGRDLAMGADAMLGGASFDPEAPLRAIQAMHVMVDGAPCPSSQP